MTRSSCTPRTPTPSPATCSTDTPARDLEITARNLEDAFLALTSESDEPADASDEVDTTAAAAQTALAITVPEGSPR